jgi:hypothetical protein
VNWKPTAALAALLALALVVYFAWNPVPPVLTKEERKLSAIPSGELVRIEVARRGEAPFVVERAKDSVGDYWRLSPSGLAADPAAVQKMIFGLDRFLRSSAVDPSRPDAAPSATGLDAPRVSVTFDGGGRKETYRFGSSSPTNTESVFVRLEGDPAVYRVDRDTAGAYDRPPADLRSKQLLRFVPHRAVAVEAKFRFTVGRPGQAPKVEYEESSIEKVETGVERGWWLVKPHREKLNDLVVNRLLSDLSNLQADSFDPASDEKARELDQPEFVVSVRLFENPNPVTLHFGGPADGVRKRWAQVPGSREHALVQAVKYKDLPKQRGDFRSRILYTFSKEQVKTLEVEADGLGRLVIERRETRKEGGPVPSVTWEVLEPKGIRIRKEKVEPYVRDVLAAGIEGFVGSMDFRQVKPDSPFVTMSVETTDGKKQRASFKTTGSSAWGQKEGVDEVFEVLPSYVKLLQLLELALLQEEVFNVQRTDLRKFEFRAKFKGQEPIQYAVELDVRSGKWMISGPGGAPVPANADRAGGFLTMLSYIAADQGRYVGRDAATLEKYRLNEPVAPARLTIWHEGGPKEGTTILISDNQSTQPATFMYLARRADSPAVFRVVSQLVEALKLPPR